jgi:hypothetical protein
VSTPGFFISFEGGDGVGKSTQASLLGDWLADLTGREVVLTFEPGGTALGKELRAAVMHGQDMGPRAEALIYAADRAHHVETVVRPALGRGAVVITDRYLDSSVAYQSGGRALPGHQEPRADQPLRKPAGGLGQARQDGCMSTKLSGPARALRADNGRPPRRGRTHPRRRLRPPPRPRGVLPRPSLARRVTRPSSPTTRAVMTVYQILVHGHPRPPPPPRPACVL